MASVKATGHHAKAPKRGKLRGMHITAAKNGVSVQHSYHPADGQPYSMGPEEDPHVFNKRSQAMAHMREHLPALMPGGKPNDDDGDEVV